MCTPDSQATLAPRATRTYEAFHRLSQELVATAAADGTIVYASPALRGLLGLDVEDVVAHGLWDLVHPDDAADVRRGFSRVLSTGAARTSTVRVRSGDGSYRWLESTTANLLEASLGGIVCTLRDVTDQIASDRALRASEARYRLIADTAEEGIWAISDSCTTLYANARMARILGLQDDEPCDFAVFERLDPGAAAEVRRRLRSRASRGPERYEIAYAHPDGRARRLWLSVAPLRDADGVIEGSLAMVSDITEVREAEQELRSAALRDPLTQLPNRPLLVDRLAHTLTRPDGMTSVLFIDLDNFKLVNDSRGHDVGDQLLVLVAERLVRTVRPHDTVARFGGDEFVVICADTDVSDAEALAEEVVRVLSSPFEIGGGPVHAAASVGVATAAARSCSAGDLLRYADTAMYSAKAAGRGRVRVFDPSLAADAEDEYLLAADLRAALAEDRLEIHYQPIIALASGAVTGLEALARWRHPDRGDVPPGRFVPVAERAGIAAQLDRWVLRRALREMGGLRHAGAVPREAVLAVNVSARNLGDVSLDELLRWAEQAGVPAQQVSLEITETAIMQDPAAAVALLGRLRQQGFRVAIDDFGTGYSSLAYLRDLPITTLKIDRSFVADITSSEDALAIVVSIFDLGRAVGVDVVAEGVETAEQARVLRKLGCAAAQGWWWSRAVPPEELRELDWESPQRGAGVVVGGSHSQPHSPVTNEHGLSRLLELHAAGASHSTIAAALNAEGFRTPTGYRWHTKSVARIITAVAYPALDAQRRPPGPDSGT